MGGRSSATVFTNRENRGPQIMNIQFSFSRIMKITLAIRNCIPKSLWLENSIPLGGLTSHNQKLTHRIEYFTGKIVVVG